jgi:hypothetical protein
VYNANNEQEEQGHTHAEDIFAQSGVYKLTCPDCMWARLTEFSEPDLISTNAPTYTTNKMSKYALHILDHSHSVGTIHDVMQILHLRKKGIHLDTIEHFHIHGKAATDRHLNDDHTLSNNIIFDNILRYFGNEVQ